VFGFRDVLESFVVSQSRQTTEITETTEKILMFYLGALGVLVVNTQPLCASCALWFPRKL